MVLDQYTQRLEFDITPTSWVNDHVDLQMVVGSNNQNEAIESDMMVERVEEERKSVDH